MTLEDIKQKLDQVDAELGMNLATNAGVIEQFEIRQVEVPFPELYSC